MHSENITPHRSHISAEEREAIAGHTPVTLWFTGLSASGKSTLAYSLERALIEKGRACYVLDGDNIRNGLNNNLGFSEEDRSENIRRIAEVAKLMNEAGLIVISAFISPARRDRLVARQIVGEQKFIEVYVSTPLEVCERRDPKGLYAKARSGAIKEFTGISADYEHPLNPELIINTSIQTLQANLEKILVFMNLANP